MDETIRTWLFDVLNAIRETESFFEGQPKLFDSYRNDIRTKRAVERNLEIMGEAVNRILKVDPEFSLSNARLIVATRNRIIHGYDAVSDELIWSIVINHLPKSKVEISGLLQ